MTEPRENTSEAVVRNVKALRRARGWNVARLAERCAATGYPALTASVLFNIEGGRRDEQGRRRREVSVDELVALARALDVKPETLLYAVEHRAGAAQGSVPVAGLALPATIEVKAGDATVVYTATEAHAEVASGRGEALDATVAIAVSGGASEDEDEEGADDGL